MTRKIKVLIVDDSRTARALIRKSISDHSDIEILGEACNPIEARDIIIENQPDVITLDVEMPGMNGLQFLDKIMRLRPIPVIMVSSLTQKGANTAIKALQMGAFDCLPKTTSDGSDPFAGLARLIREAFHSGFKGINSLRAKTGIHEDHSWGRKLSLIGIGASTGGVEAIEEVIKNFPANSPPVIICQHMPSLYTESFANRLNKYIPQLSIAQAIDLEPLKRGMVRIAPGGDCHLSVIKTSNGFHTRLKRGELISGHRPSIDMMFESMAKITPKSSLGILLTGMGRDGANGLLALRNAGGYTIAQDKSTSVVYGMPRVAKEIGAAEHVLPLTEIPRKAFQIE